MVNEDLILANLLNKKQLISACAKHWKVSEEKAKEMLSILYNTQKFNRYFYANIKVSDFLNYTDTDSLIIKED